MTGRRTDERTSLSQVTAAAHEWYGEGVLVNVVAFVGRRQHFGLVNVVHAKLLEDLHAGEGAVRASMDKGEVGNACDDHGQED